MINSAVIKRQKEKQISNYNQFFATTFMGLEQVLAKELMAIGAKDIKIASRGVGFKGDLEIMYKANLWLRTAHRVLFQIAEFDAADRDALYKGVKAVNWGEHMTLEMTLAVDTVGTNANLIHTQFTSRVVKDGVVDWFRERTGDRPSVDFKNPDLKLSAKISDDRCILSWDTSGERLHQRGYRPGFGGPAPLKENLAAGLLLLSEFDGTDALIDPMCGSGTILIEGALIAKNIAPGLLGRRFAFSRHKSFNMRMWANLQSDAKNEIREIDGCPIIGFDISGDAVRAAKTAATGAGVDDIIRIKRAPLKDLPTFKSGMVVTNPPYGERLGEINQLADLYTLLGDSLKHKCTGMSAHIITASKFLAGKVGLRTSRRDPVWNGPLECRLLHYDLY
jgi:putative N6-adenine-specific DNA methylase